MARLKKFWLLGFLALFVAVSASSAAAVTVTIPNTSGSGTISIPVNIDNATGLAGFTFRITYNPAVLTATGVVAGTLPTGWVLLPNLTASGVVQVGSFSPTLTELTGGAGSLVRMNFNVIGAPGSTSAVNFTSASLTNATGAIIASTTANGTFTVPVAPVKILSVAPADRPVAFGAGTTTFAVSNTGTAGTTMAWTAAVTTGGTWLSITSGSSGSNSGTINAAFTKNTTGSTRTGTITVTATGATGSPKAVTVTQAAEVVVPLAFNLKLYNQAGVEITGNVLVDTPIKAKGVLSGGDGSALAISQWVVNDRPLVDTVFVDTTNSGNLDSAWLPANLLEPGKAYTLKGRAKNLSGAWSAWATLDFNTILQAAVADADGDGVPDDQTPTDTDLRTYGFDPASVLPDTALIVRFDDKAILVESADSDTMSYFAGIARPLEAPPLSGSNPYGVFTTRVEVPVAGNTISLTYTFPEALPAGTEWYKYDESAPAGSKWSSYPDAVIPALGKTVTVELKDGGKGDADGVANGIIIDPAGPVVVPVSEDSGDSGSLPVGPLAAGISGLLVWLKRRKQR